MKKLMAIAIGVLFAGATSAKALVGVDKITYDGSLEVKGISANNELDSNDKVTESDHRGETNTRVRLGINGAITEGVTGRIEFGRTNSTYGRGTSGAGTSNSIQNETDLIKINNAYVELGDLLGLGVKLGRQYVGNANDLVWFIGPRQGDAMAIDAVDGLNLSKKIQMVDVNLFLGKALKQGGQGTTNRTGDAGSVNVNSLDVVVDKIVPGAKINVGYLWGVQTSTSPRNSLSTLRIGIGGGVMENMITYNAEYLANMGENHIPVGSKVKYEGTAIDLGVGYNGPELPIGKFAANIGYLIASGDDKVGDNKDKSFHDFSTLGVNSSDRYYGQILSKSDAIGVIYGSPGVDTGVQGAGLTVLNIGVSYIPKWMDNKTSAKLEYFDLKYTEDGVNSAAYQAGNVASEYDLTLGYKATDNVGVNAGYAYMKPDKGIVGTVPGTKKDPATELFANLMVKWGSAE